MITSATVAAFPNSPCATNDGSEWTTHVPAGVDRGLGTGLLPGSAGAHRRQRADDGRGGQDAQGTQEVTNQSGSPRKHGLEPLTSGL